METSFDDDDQHGDSYASTINQNARLKFPMSPLSDEIDLCDDSSAKQQRQRQRQPRSAKTSIPSKPKSRRGAQRRRRPRARRAHRKSTSVAQRAQANVRERARMQVLSDAFFWLKTSLPWVPADTKLSKLDTLRLATNYINHLDDVLHAEEEDKQTVQATRYRKASVSGKRNDTTCFVSHLQRFRLLVVRHSPDRVLLVAHSAKTGMAIQCRS